MEVLEDPEEAEQKEVSKTEVKEKSQPSIKEPTKKLSIRKAEYSD